MPSAAASPALPARLLVVRLGAIGDVVNALAFATAVKQADARVHVGWVVHPLAAPLLEGHPDVDRVHVWPRRSGAGGFLRLVRELRAARYAAAVDLQRIQKSALLARLAGAPRVLGFERAWTKEASFVWTREHVRVGDARHMRELYLAAARHLGCPATAVAPRLARDPAAEAWAEALVGALGDRPVLVNLGASKPANRWAPERSGELARRIHAELGAPVCLTGGPDDRAAAERAAVDDGVGVRDLVGRTSLLQLAALAARARLFVGCDTGPMHLAAAAGAPVVALFGPADPARTGPWGAGHRIVRVPPACAPCGRKTCDQPRHACMEDIEVERVLAEVRAALA